MIKVISIEPSKTKPEEWLIVKVANVLSGFFQARLDGAGFDGKTTSFPVKVGQTQFVEGQEFPDVEITTLSREAHEDPFYVGQELFNGKYYQNIITPVNAPVVK
jgi:hypothetical protein